MNRQIGLKLSKFIIYHCFQMSVSLNYSLHCGLWQIIDNKKVKKEVLGVLSLRYIKKFNLTQWTSAWRSGEFNPPVVFTHYFLRMENFAEILIHKRIPYVLDEKSLEWQTQNTIQHLSDNHTAPPSLICAPAKPLVQNEQNVLWLADLVHDKQQCPGLCFQSNPRS